MSNNKMLKLIASAVIAVSPAAIAPALASLPAGAVVGGTLVAGYGIGSVITFAIKKVQKSLDNKKSKDNKDQDKTNPDLF